MEIIGYALAIFIAFTAGWYYPATDPALTPTFVVDIFVMFFLGLLLSRTARLLVSSIRFRLGLRRAMKELAA